MKLTTIKRQHKDKWVLAKVEKKDNTGQVTQAKPLATSKSKSYIVRRAKELKPQNFTIFFTGKPKKYIWM